MLNNIIDGISVKLDKSFGEKYTIYSEDVEQGINEPCFFICPLNPSKVSYPSGRTLKKNSFDVHYFPKSNDKSFEINEVAEMLLEELEYIEIDGDLVRGTNMNFEIVDNV
ncbi:phage tail terminator family protein, partial [Clostridioides difficile]